MAISIILHLGNNENSENLLECCLPLKNGSWGFKDRRPDRKESRNPLWDLDEILQGDENTMEHSADFGGIRFPDVAVTIPPADCNAAFLRRNRFYLELPVMVRISQKPKELDYQQMVSIIEPEDLDPDIPISLHRILREIS